VRIFKGFAVDRLKSEDFLILDDNIVEFDEYVDASALDQRTWMTVDDAKAHLPHGDDRRDEVRPAAHRPGASPGGQSPDNTAAGDMYVCVLEIWDKKNGVVRTVVKGMNRWAREPYAPKNVAQRWYPFFVLGFNVVEGRWRPISDVELLKGLQDEYNTTRTNYADVREKAAPKRIMRKGGNLSEEDVKNIMNSGNKDWVAVEGNPATPISQDVMELEGLKIDPQAYDVTVIRNDMDLVVGRSDASRANLIKPKTATEAEIMQEAMSTRTSRAPRHERGPDERYGDRRARDRAAGPVEAGGAADRRRGLRVARCARIGRGHLPPGRGARARRLERQAQPGAGARPVVEAAAADQRTRRRRSRELRQQGMYQLGRRAGGAAARNAAPLRRAPRPRRDHPAGQARRERPARRAAAGRAELVQVKEQLGQLQEALAKCQEDLRRRAGAGEAADQGRAGEDRADPRRRRERDAKREKVKAADDSELRALDKALLDAATKVVTSQLTAVIAANAKDPEAQEREAKVALSEERMGEVLKELTTTMDRLGSAFDRFKPQQQGAGA
jgi:hypothetical protein